MKKELKLLMVEDAMFMRAILESIIHKNYKNVEIVMATNGQEGLDKFSPEFDLVLTDITMPFMDGIEMSRKMKEIYAKQKIMAVTSLQGSSLSKRFEFDEIIQKPFIEKDIVNALDIVLSDRIPLEPDYLARAVA